MKKILISLLIICSCFMLASCQNKCEEKKEEKKSINYLVLVNKQNKLPDDWEQQVELESAIDAWGDEVKVEKEALKHFYQLKDDLDNDNIYIELDSIYRSVKEQQELWDRWTIEKGEDYVKKYVSTPGYSEHHTGLAIDICIKKDGKIIADNNDMIKERKIFEKIHNKLAEYGFILRYLENKDDITGYSYEPWHLRYINDPTIAKYIMDNKLTFEEYLNQRN